MNFLRVFIILVTIVMTASVQAATCFITLIKDSCWLNYNVTFSTFDAEQDKELATLTIPAASAWARKSFECTLSQRLKFQAQFTPTFWDSGVGKIYNSKTHKTLPAVMKPGERAWHITVYYPRDFSEIPF